MENKKTIEEIYNELISKPLEERNRIIDSLSAKELYELSLYMDAKENNIPYEEPEDSYTEPVVLRPYKNRSARWGRAFSEVALANAQIMRDSIHDRQLANLEDGIDRHR